MNQELNDNDMMKYDYLNPHPVIIVNGTGDIIGVNASAGELFENNGTGSNIKEQLSFLKHVDFNDIITNDKSTEIQNLINNHLYKLTIVGSLKSREAYIYGIDTGPAPKDDTSRAMQICFEHSPEPIMSFNSGGIIINANYAAKIIFGFDNIEGMTLEKVFPDRNIEIFINVKNKDFVEEFEYTTGGEYYKFIIKWIPKQSIGFIYGTNTSALKESGFIIEEHELRFRNLFEKMPISIWEEDFTELREYLDFLKSSGVTDFNEHFATVRGEVARCAEMIEVLNVNQETVKLFGASSESELLENIGSTFTSASLLSFKDVLIAVAESKEGYECESEYRTFKGNTEHVVMKMSFNRNPKGRYIALVSMFNITHRKQLENELIENERKFRAISSSAQDAIIMLDNSGRITFWNESASLVFGYSDTEVLSKYYYDIIIPENERGKLKERFEDFRNRDINPTTGRTIELLFKRKNDEIFPAEISLAAVKIKGKWSAISIIRDISERKKSEKELRKLTSAVVNNPASIVISDLEGRIEYANPKFLKLTGYSLEEAVGKKISILKSGRHPDETYKELWETITSGRTWKGELYNLAKDGSYFWESISISPIKDSRGDIVNYVGVKEDITHRKHNERRIKNLIEELKELNSSKDKFFSIIAHDLKGPFSGFLGLSELMATEYTNLDAESISQMADSMYKAAKNLFDLLENLLDWSRAQTGGMLFNPLSINLIQLVAKITGLFRETASNKQIHFNIDIDPNISVFADLQMLNTCIRNLVSNALKFTEKGGDITISANDEENEYTLISVIDTGIGMNEEALGKIFRIDMKYTTSGTENEKGTGLGLLLCKELVEKNGGEIFVESELYKGSNFTFTIPKNDNQS